MKRSVFIMFFCLWSMLYGLWSCDVFAQESTLSDHCQQMFKAEGKCPGDICMMVFLDDLETENAKQICQAKPCGQIAVQDCPEDFCAKMTDCRGSEICQSKMIDPPQCGNLSYAGQDVLCCEGLVRRCGMAFLDDTCDMYGDNSEYNLPICIPCGDGVCTNFENVCNCPEDCWPGGDREYEGQKFDGS